MFECRSAWHWNTQLLYLLVFQIYITRSHSVKVFFFRRDSKINDVLFLQSAYSNFNWIAFMSRTGPCTEQVFNKYLSVGWEEERKDRKKEERREGELLGRPSKKERQTVLCLTGWITLICSHKISFLSLGQILLTFQGALNAFPDRGPFCHISICTWP